MPRRGISEPEGDEILVTMVLTPEEARILIAGLEAVATPGQTENGLSKDEENIVWHFATTLREQANQPR